MLEEGVVYRLLNQDPARCAAVLARVAEARLERTTANEMPWHDCTFDGAIAVNSLQLWDPIDASAAEVSRVLKPGAPLVTITHDWALRRHAPSVEVWLQTATAALDGAGFETCRSWMGKAASGGTVTLVARRGSPPPG